MSKEKSIPRTLRLIVQRTETIELQVPNTPGAPAAALAALNHNGSGYRLIAVDDQDVLGACENCPTTILLEGTYSVTEEGLYLCAECAAALLQEQQAIGDTDHE